MVGRWLAKTGVICHIQGMRYLVTRALMHPVAPGIFGTVIAMMIGIGMVMLLRRVASYSLPLFIVTCLAVLGLSILSAVLMDRRRP